MPRVQFLIKKKFQRKNDLKQLTFMPFDSITLSHSLGIGYEKEESFVPIVIKINLLKSQLIILLIKYCFITTCEILYADPKNKYDDFSSIFLKSLNYQVEIKGPI